MIRIILFLFFCLNGFVLMSQEMIGWTLISDGKEKSIYVKNLPIQEPSENNTEFEDSGDNKEIFKHWVQIIFKNGGNKVGNKVASYNMEIWQFDLKNKMSRTEHVYVYDKAGHVIYDKEYDYDSKFEYIIPGSVGEGAYNAIVSIYNDKLLAKAIEELCEKLIIEINGKIVEADDLCNSELYKEAIEKYMEAGDMADKMTCTSEIDVKGQVSKKVLFAKQGQMIYKQFLSLLAKADSVYKADIRNCIPYYKECLGVKEDLSVRKKITAVERELDVLDFKEYVRTKKNEYDSLNKIFMLNDSLILKVLILDKEHFTNAYNIIYNDFLNTSYHCVFLKEYFFRKKDLEITSVDEQVKEHLKLFSDEYKNIITIQNEIIKTDRKVIKSQNRKFKKCDFNKNTIIAILNDKGD